MIVSTEEAAFPFAFLATEKTLIMPLMNIVRISTTIKNKIKGNVINHIIPIIQPIAKIKIYVGICISFKIKAAITILLGSSFLTAIIKIMLHIIAAKKQKTHKYPSAVDIMLPVKCILKKQ